MLHTDNDTEIDIIYFRFSSVSVIISFAVWFSAHGAPHTQSLYTDNHTTRDTHILRLFFSGWRFDTLCRFVELTSSLEKGN